MDDGAAAVDALPKLTGPDRPIVYCPFCGRPGVYRVFSLDGTIAHFAHEGGKTACVASALESVLHQRAKAALLSALGQLRREGKPLRSTLRCQRCNKPFTKVLLRPGDWTDEAVEWALPGSARVSDVVALQAGAPALLFEVYASHRVDAEKSADYVARSVAGIELDARAFFHESGRSSWTATNPLPLPLESWNLEQAPRSFNVCPLCRQSIEGVSELTCFVEMLERQDLPTAREFAARLAPHFSVASSVALTYGIKPLLDAVRAPEELRSILGETEATAIAQRATWPPLTRAFFDGLEWEPGPWERLPLVAILRNPYKVLLSLIQERSSVKAEWLACADRIAAVLRLDCRDDLLAAHAGMVLLRRLEQKKDTALAAHNLVDRLVERLAHVPRAEIETWLAWEARQGRVLRVVQHGEVRMVALASVFALEAKAARITRWRLNRKVPRVKELVLSAALTEGQGSELTDEQRQAILVALSHRFSVITGGPGTGKTTVVKSILAATQALPGGGGEWYLAAPTHKAVQRLRQATSPFSTARTARTLQNWLKQEEDLKRNPPFGLIVDEAGFVSVEHLVELLEIARYIPRLVLVGDPNQLPSISFGAVLRDLLECAQVPAVRLRVAHRASDVRGLRAAAERILGRQIPQETCGVRLVYTATGDEVQSAVGEHRRLVASEGQDTQVIAPSRKLVKALNKILREECNPRGSHLDGVKGLRSGERVICTETYRELGLFNGQTGNVEGVEDGKLVLVIEGARLTVPIELVESCLQPAYAITVHKSQGSEWQNVIVVFDESSGWVDQSLMFTAATRARETLSLVGPRAAIEGAARTVRRRLSLLGAFLNKEFKIGGNRHQPRRSGSRAIGAW